MGQESITNESEELNKKDKLDAILSLFGSDAARDAFINTCKEYVAARKISLPGPDGENYSDRPKRYSPPQRAHLHNSIMDTLSRLAIQSKDLSPIQRDIFREMHDRNNAGEIIRAYVVAQEGKEDDEDIDEKQRRRGKMSDIAHFHSLGKEH
ncbi:MAG: hypothetical protein A3J04_01270 [Candidatus Ryanbacteria bacterium RIFCSPLOWO2_02_FULL_47_14]|uniref:Uncharacterized protein n=1 Tax=Candidatus Ryanbacteria bacterium RIFCSPLOWO2_02_FULL_47_14 TaxID=1802129 RepID=A0A1G2H3H1_9BACT|nr:MAG: hypothetical protein UY36_C0006G0021 [Parcubacteria group bacterium GW2011_GWA1_49_11]OGZ57026.1 MAG: hypothetical protein A3J04_01270 [Candidatus Ryanbacteria bacterium RIFCSPLOWO2_02_FULL_47_14]